MFVMEWYYDFVPNSEYSQKICIVSDIKINIPNVQDQIIFLLKFEREIFHSKYVPLSISIFHDIRSYRDSTSNVCIFFFFFFFLGNTYWNEGSMYNMTTDFSGRTKIWWPSYISNRRKRLTAANTRAQWANSVPPRCIFTSWMVNWIESYAFV